MTCTFHEYMYKMKYIYAGMNVDGLEMHDKVSSSKTMSFSRHVSRSKSEISVVKTER